MAVFIQVHVVGAIEPEYTVLRTTRGAIDLWLNVMLEIPVQRIVLRESPKIDSVHGCGRPPGIKTYVVMERMEGYVKVLEKSSSPPSTMRGGVKYCAQDDSNGGKRLKSYGPLIKSPDEALPQDTQQEPSAAKGEDS
jgi:hypothetical protein